MAVALLASLGTPRSPKVDPLPDQHFQPVSKHEIEESKASEHNHSNSSESSPSDLIRVDAADYADAVEADLSDVFDSRKDHTAAAQSAKALPQHGIRAGETAALPQDEPWLAARSYVELDEGIFNGEAFVFSPKPGLDYKVVVDRVVERKDASRSLFGRLFDVEGTHAGFRDSG